jgi:hypothetical protein
MRRASARASLEVTLGAHSSLGRQRRRVGQPILVDRAAELARLHREEDRSAPQPVARGRGTAATEAQSAAPSGPPSPFIARPFHWRVSLWLWTSLLVALAAPTAFLAVYSVVRSDQGALADAGLWCFFLSMASIVAMSRLVGYVAADDSGVTVRGIGVKRRIPWSAICDVGLTVRNRGAGGAEVTIVSDAMVLEFKTPNGNIKALALAGSGPRMDRLRTDILRYRDSRTAPGTLPVPSVVTSGGTWVAPTIIFALLILPMVLIFAGAG